MLDALPPRVRLATPADDAAIVALMLETHAVHVAALPAVFQPVSDAVVSLAEVAALRAAPGHRVFVAERGGAIVGYAHVEAKTTPATAYGRASALLHVHGMGVTAAVRGAGVGRALLAAVRAEAIAQGMQGVSLDVFAFNDRARAFYEREGFLVQRERRVCPLVPRTEPSARD